MPTHLGPKRAAIAQIFFFRNCLKRETLITQEMTTPGKNAAWMSTCCFAKKNKKKKMNPKQWILRCLLSFCDVVPLGIHGSLPVSKPHAFSEISAFALQIRLSRWNQNQGIAVAFTKPDIKLLLHHCNISWPRGDSQKRNGSQKSSKKIVVFRPFRSLMHGVHRLCTKPMAEEHFFLSLASHNFPKSGLSKNNTAFIKTNAAFFFPFLFFFPQLLKANYIFFRLQRWIHLSSRKSCHAAKTVESRVIRQFQQG